VDTYNIFIDIFVISNSCASKFINHNPNYSGYKGRIYPNKNFLRSNEIPCRCKCFHDFIKDEEIMFNHLLLERDILTLNFNCSITSYKTQVKLSSMDMYKIHFPGLCPTVCICVYLFNYQSNYLSINLKINSTTSNSIHKHHYRRHYYRRHSYITILNTSYIERKLYTFGRYVSIYLFIYVSIYISMYLCIYLFIYVSVYLSMHLSMYLSIYL
jgi:hypothetical protein